MQFSSFGPEKKYATQEKQKGQDFSPVGFARFLELVKKFGSHKSKFKAI